MICRETGNIELTAKQVIAYDDFRNGRDTRKIQDVFPELSNELREQIMTGTHPECWNTMFAETECDEDCDGSSHPELFCK
jgi:hypothetical protein